LPIIWYLEESPTPLVSFDDPPPGYVKSIIIIIIIIVIITSDVTKPAGFPQLRQIKFPDFSR